MQTIERKLKDFDPLLFEVDLSEYDKTNADVEDIFFSVKDDLTSADDAILFKTLLTNGISYTGTKILSVIVDWLETDYTNITVGKEYILADHLLRERQRNLREQVGVHLLHSARRFGSKLALGQVIEQR